MADRTTVYEIRIEQGQALADFERINKALQNNRAERVELNKAVKQNIKDTKEIEKAIQAEGADVVALTGKLTKLKRNREALNRSQSEAEIVNKALSAQTRELGNDLAGLTENQLRFRDKMAQATLEAIKQSGVLGDLAARSNRLETELQDVGNQLKSAADQLTALNVAFAKGEASEEEYRKEAERLNEEIAQGKNIQKQFADELTVVKTKSDQLSQELQQLEKDFRDGRISAEEFRKAAKAIDGQIGDLTNKFDSFTKNQGAELKSTLTGLITNYIGVGAAIYGVVGILKDASQTVLEFEAGLSSIAALGGEYSERVDELGEAAKTAGIKFGFGATESVKAVEALAKAGLSVEQILGGGLEGALTLAAAGQVDLANAAETAASALTQFGLKGSEVSRVADALVGGANAAQGGVDELRQALNQSGLVASQFGLTLEETVGALTTFASAGLLGSDAGTSFRAMLLRLGNPTKESKALMEELSLELFNSKGEFIGIEATAEQLQKRLGNLTDEQRAATLATIFGQDAIRAANVLYEKGAEGVVEYTEAVSVAGTALDVSQKQTDNLRGAIDRAGAAWDAFVLGIEDGEGIISSTFTNLVNGFSFVVNALSGADVDQKVKAFTTLVQSEYEAIGGAGQLAAEKGSGLTESFRQTLLVAKAYAKTSENLELIEASRNLVVQKSSELFKLYMEERRTGTKILTDQQRIELAAARATLTGLSDEIAERKGLTKAIVDGGAKSDAVAVESAETVAKARQRVKDAIVAEKAAQDTLLATDVEGLRLSNLTIDNLQKELDALNNKTGGVVKLTEAQKAQAEAQFQAAKEAQDIQLAAQENIFAENPQDTGANIYGGGANFDDLFGEDLQADIINGEEERFAAQLELWAAEEQAFSDLQDAKFSAVQGFASSLRSLTDGASDGAKALLAVEKAASIAQVIVKGVEEVARINAATSLAPPLAAALTAAAKIRTGISVAAIAGTAIRGIAEGGEVDERWGPRISRANGDNRLARTSWGGFATLKDGEVVLNDAQQAKVRRRTGIDIRALADLPTRARASMQAMRSDMRDRFGSLGGYATGGIISAPVNTLSSDRVAQNILIAGLDTLANTPIYTVITDVSNGLQRQTIITEASSSR